MPHSSRVGGGLAKGVQGRRSAGYDKWRGAIALFSGSLTFENAGEWRVSLSFRPDGCKIVAAALEDEMPRRPEASSRDRTRPIAAAVIAVLGNS